MEVGVGVNVVVTPNDSGSIGAGVSVTRLCGIGEEVGGIPPSGVGVAYCPHKEAFPMQDASMEDVIMRKMMARFTISVR